MIRIKARAPTARAAALPTVWGAVAVAYKFGCPLAQQNGLGARIVTSAVFFAVGTGLIAHVRRALLRELRQVRRVARAAQSVVLRPLPPRLDGLRVAAAQLSADRGASVGGDLYEAIATEHGVRVVMGDVRGHGLAALGTVAAVLGSFREAAHDEPELGGVLARLDRALARHLRERARAEHPAHGGQEPDQPVAEEFVTVLLLEIDRDGRLRALNCGHPWPYLLSGTRVEPLTRVDPLPPLGPFPLPAELEAESCGHLVPGESLVLFTDGVEDARDSRGRFFSLPRTLREVVRDHPVSPQTVLRTVFRALLHHTSGKPTDDIALLVLRNDRTRGEASCPGARHPRSRPGQATAFRGGAGGLAGT
ncbi:serine phosphatase RsbU (regulator of sigma subunit) [Streptomyces puniciscabiei]|uniref:Serine phosphatase RsbU (Regulator of sigma subunit) n=1 Tax=Streptomyces puniciscabiei TaxID=164348 RepID=A0A542UMG2_9ACTN|nr:PP2C family protein-serine/threonine phosphatase [Streptomyces puniciscabiei]TQL00294.1 serine phosphatase RsbU (regulator of sigma subunit) [Streptomyces puniciscabiei]